jgi:hypothetical protein
MDIVDAIMSYESGEMDLVETCEFFSRISKDGTVFHLQGHYGRTLQNLIDNDVLIRFSFDVNYSKLEELGVY